MAGAGRLPGSLPPGAGGRWPKPTRERSEPLRPTRPGVAPRRYWEGIRPPSKSILGEGLAAPSEPWRPLGQPVLARAAGVQVGSAIAPEGGASNTRLPFAIARIRCAKV